MKWLSNPPEIYLHKDAVDFRKAINGLVVIVEQEMALSAYADAIFVFCNKHRDKLKVLHWDQTGFCLWYKRLEKARFKWPKKHQDDIISLQPEQLRWLLDGYDIMRMAPHERLHFSSDF